METNRPKLHFASLKEVKTEELVAMRTYLVEADKMKYFGNMDVFRWIARLDTELRYRALNMFLGKTDPTKELNYSKIIDRIDEDNMQEDLFRESTNDLNVL